jgi:hypothetical protein
MLQARCFGTENAARQGPDLLRLAVKYVTNPRASGGMPPDGFPLSKSAQNFQALVLAMVTGKTITDHRGFP